MQTLVYSYIRVDKSIFLIFQTWLYSNNQDDQKGNICNLTHTSGANSNMSHKELN